MAIQYKQNKGRNEFRIEQITISREINSAEISDFKAVEIGSISKSLERTIRINLLGTILLWCVILAFANPVLVLLPIAGIVLKILCRSAFCVKLEYDLSSEELEAHMQRVNAWQTLFSGKKEWQILTEQFNNNRKTNAGAGRSIKRTDCKILTKTPYFINTNVKVVEILLAKKERLIILPDRLFFVRKNKVGVVEYKDLNINASHVEFIETEPIPKDAQVIGKTYLYVNKDGTPDKRFKNNKELPVCLYGRILLRSFSGLEVELQISNVQNSEKFAELIKK